MRHKATITSILLYAILTTSCGTDGGGGTTANPSDVADQPEAGTEQQPDPDTLGSYETFYVQKMADMGECTKEKQSHLIYVKKEKAFFTCDDAGWGEVDVPTEVEADDPLVWFDEYRDMTWHLMGSTAGSTVGQMIAVCEDQGLTFPLRDDLVDAVQSGMWTYYNVAQDGGFSAAFGLMTTGGTNNHRAVDLASGSDTGGYTKSNLGAANEKWTLIGSASVYCYE